VSFGGSENVVIFSHCSSGSAASLSNGSQGIFYTYQTKVPRLDKPLLSDCNDAERK
jgi:hypothetical protein